ncbi:GNAT family N-acetyltransferase [Massilia sp. R2A-15]|uniref:GNAT family N-acetyltransferase n=1 Tax=Massilia sp. R2A-15 TaxID=3064278 RepID=UPI002736A73A|nr:GNAT family N-acetyltransferase [Massilia sp. R2A-15]WLI89124.1 GNAT family N-acetyltransferase [Massilia sp. R2A-15]
MNQDYSAHNEIPAVDDYLRLRRIAGLTPRTSAAAQAGLPNTIAGVVIRNDGMAVGMGRVIGDGLFYQVVDIAVDPKHQKKGLGKAIMASLMAQLERLVPSEAYVSLIADGEAHRLYAQFGFKPTAPASIGMAQWIAREQ